MGSFHEIMPPCRPTIVSKFTIVRVFLGRFWKCVTLQHFMTERVEGGQQNYGAIGIGAVIYGMLPFHTSTVVKVLRIVGLFVFPLLCLQKLQYR